MIKAIIFILIILSLIFMIMGAVSILKRSPKPSKNSIIIRDLLPGLNCGTCGRKKCIKFAQDVDEGKVSLEVCPYMTKTNYKRAKVISDKNRIIKFDNVAFVKCKGGSDCENKFEYIGDNSCATKNLQHSGDKFCPYACLGCGDCAKVCPYDAIYISDKGCAVVDKNKCVGCGECVAVCPNKLIALIPFDQYVEPICNNISTDSVITRKCKVACTHCEACVSSCPVDAISMVGGIPKIDNKKCIKCGKCVSVCPNHVISRI